ncbi:MAG: hypothetical protein JXR77_14020, partial [Lentisphaeria bacterium]|nr:hypothetical protein [Lentisphaeria bacterium]
MRHRPVGAGWLMALLLSGGPGGLCGEGMGAPPAMDAGAEFSCPFVTVYRAARPPAVDGALDDACWRHGLGMGPFLDPAGEAEPGEATRALVCYDGEALYLAVEAFESLLDPTLQRVHEVAAEVTERDGPVTAEESVTVFLQPDPQRDTYYQVAANLIGTVLDARGTEGEVDSRWDARARVAVRTGTSSWTVEMAIPFAVLGGAPGAGAEWRGNVCRNNRAHGERSCWSATAHGSPVPGRFGRIRFGGAPLLALRSVVLPRAQEGTAALTATLANATEAPLSATIHLIARYGDGPPLSWPAAVTLAPGETRVVQCEGILTLDNQAFRLDAIDAKADSVLCFRSNRLRVEPDREYDVSALVRTADLIQGRRPLALSISSYDTAGQAIRTYETILTVPEGSGDWQRLTGTWRSPANADTILLWFVKWGGSGVKGTVLVDDLFLGLRGSLRNLVPNGALDSNEYREFRPWEVVLPRAASYPREPRVTMLAEVAAVDGALLARSAARTTELAPNATAIDSSLVLCASRTETGNMHVLRELHVAANGYLSLPLVLRSGMREQLDACTVIMEMPACMRLIDPHPAGAITALSTGDEGRRRYEVVFDRDRISPARVDIASTRTNYLILVCDWMPQGDRPEFLTIQAAAGEHQELPRQYPLHILPPLQWKRPRNALIKNWACSSFYRPLQRLNEAMREAVFLTWRQAGFNAIGSVATHAVAERYGFLLRGHLPSVPGGSNFPGGAEFLSAHPEARAVAFDGTARETHFCPTFFLSDRNPHFAEIDAYLAEQACRHDILDWDLEVPVLRDTSVCLCERCLAELRQRPDLPDEATLTAESLRNAYREAFTDFRCRQNAAIAARYRRAIKAANPDAILSVYSGYQGDTRWRYGVDWQPMAAAADLVWAGYGRPVEGIRATHAALGGKPFLCGELAWFGTHPYDCGNCRVVFFRRLTDGGAGIMAYFNWIVDGRFYAAISDVAGVVADHEAFFGFDWVGEGRERTLWGRWRRDDALVRLDGEAGHADLAVLLAGEEQLVFVFNEGREARTRDIACSRWDAETVAVEYFTKAVYRQAEIRLDITPRDLRILHVAKRMPAATVGSPILLAPAEDLPVGGCRPLVAWQGTGTHPGAQRFIVEVSPDASFPAGATQTATDLPRTSWAPESPLQPAARCFVRVRGVDVVTGAAGPPSEARGFLVPTFHEVRGAPAAFSPDGDGRRDVFT